jgi:hypothetical protein
LLKNAKKLNVVDSKLSKETTMLLKVFENIYKVISARNETFIELERKTFEDFFNSKIEKYPLTKGQTRSIITDEYANLVVAGAGTGKTSTVVGKAAYILEKGLAKPARASVCFSVCEFELTVHIEVDDASYSCDFQVFPCVLFGLIAANNNSARTTATLFFVAGARAIEDFFTSYICRLHLCSLGHGDCLIEYFL